MVASLHIFPPCAILAAVLSLAAVPADAATDWQERAERAPELRRSIGTAGGDAIVLGGTLRAGFTSNAGQGFDPRPDAYTEMRQRLTIRRGIGDLEISMDAGARLVRTLSADEAEARDADIAAGLARRFGEAGGIAAAVSYALEDEFGFREHDTGLLLEGKLELRRIAPFFTAAVNDVRYDPIVVGDVLYDAGEADRTRLGVEAGAEVMLGARLAVSVSAGYVSHQYRRTFDTAGLRRSNRSAFLRTALALAGERVALEAGAMVLRRRHEEPLFATTDAVLLDASVVWQAADGTRISASYLDDIEEPVFAGTGGIRSHSATLALTQTLGETSSVTALAYGERQRYAGTSRIDTTLGALLRLETALADAAALDLSLAYEQTGTNLLSERIETWKISAGVRYAFAAGPQRLAAQY